MGTCPVCFRYTRQRVRGCRHYICTRCAEEWLRRSDSCPICRRIMQTARVRRVACTSANRKIQLKDRGHMGGVCVATTPSASGLEVGDRITHINAVRVRNSARAVHMMQSSQSPLILRTRRWMFQPWW